MNILAVIPARASSREIPNKNIRIIQGYPLIYYSIYNALNSVYITDIVVTTDSEEVSLIATQMGITCKWRDEKLCGDDVTLDEVINDAIPNNKNWDLIITMQPTSPTLSIKTLDKAIEYTIKNNLDTVISAVNKPHLSWSVIKGIKVPNYEKRLNRQYLPPNYIETGAFMISRGSVVSNLTRIGNKVDVFEMPFNEACDIDSFVDLQNAISLLNVEKVAIYVNGNNKRGTGHVYRALEVADEFFTKPDIYYDINQTKASIFGKTTHNLIPVNGIEELFERCKVKKYTIFINDILSTSVDYMIALKKNLTQCKIINFEDDGEGAEIADLVFNALYYDANLNHVYTGEKYYISKKTFMFYKAIQIKTNVKNIFISFGGADPQDYSDQLLEMISKQDYKDYNFTVVLGKEKKNVEDLLKYNKYSQIKVLHDVLNIPQLMSDCDIAITSCGRTAYELAMLGVPAIAIAQNKREEKHRFVRKETGFFYLGLNPTEEIIEDALKKYLKLSTLDRLQINKQLLSHDLRNGRKRVMALINNL